MTRQWIALLLLLFAPKVVAATLQDGFRDEVAFQGPFAAPIAVRFAPDGRVFVAEKRGTVKAYDGLEDTVPVLAVDLRGNVHDFWDRGLMGLAIDPDFPTKPYLYLLYTYNYNPLEPDADAPRWPDSCPSPPGGTDDGCVVNGRLSRVEIGPDNLMVGSEHVLLENRWCQQFPSHTVGDLAFDHDRVLYVSAGEGANFNLADYGQFGGSPDSPTPANPCADPPGASTQPPTAEGGSLRSQDLRTPGDPAGYSGAILRVNPDTGEALTSNPLFGGDPSDDRIIAYGLRNPYRFAVRPHTHELWIGDVGWRDWEELNVVLDPEDAVVENFGWPCYEGSGRTPAFDELNLDVCENLYADTVNPATAPYYAYRHDVFIDPDPEPFRCSRNGSSALSGLAFYSGSAYPEDFDDALFFADFSRSCIFVMQTGEDGRPDPATVSTFANDIPAVQLELGPDGALYYVNFSGGGVRRIVYFQEDPPPRAVIAATPTYGPLPLTVQFDGAQSTLGDADKDGADPGPAAGLTYAWDLDGDGDYDDAAGAQVSREYDTREVIVVGLRVTDDEGASDTDEVVITAGNTPPVVSITAPDPAELWHVGEAIPYQASASDPDSGAPPFDFLWTISLNHCPGGPDDCHKHPFQSDSALSRPGAFFTAPDHEWFSFLELALTVTDRGFPGSGGQGKLSTTRILTLDPEPVELTFESDPPGLELVVGNTVSVTPFTRTAIVGSSNSVSAPSPQGSLGFFSWSNGGPRSQTVVAPGQPQTYLATFRDSCAEGRCEGVLDVSSAAGDSAPYASIQEALDAVTEPGTRIRVHPGAGAYQENLTIQAEHRFTIEGVGGGDAVVIDGGAGAAITIQEGSAAVHLSHLTLRGQTGVRTAEPLTMQAVTFRSIAGTAVDLNGGEHTLSRLEMDSSVAGGIDLGAGAALHLSRSNLRDLTGTALRLAGSAEVENVLIAGSAQGIVMERSGSLELGHSTIAENLGAGLDNSEGAPVAVAYTILWGNPGGDVIDIGCAWIVGSDVGNLDCTGVNGNLSVDPQLTSDFHLNGASPALDHGPSGAELAGAPCLDLYGAVRVRDYDADGEARVDIGAIEHRNDALPGEVEGLLWVDAATLTWSAPPLATGFHVYRGQVTALPAGDAGTCRDDLDPDRTDTVLTDAELPPSGAVFIYLVTAHADGPSGSPGVGACAERDPSPRCD